jgi:hypothetical protein
MHKSLHLVITRSGSKFGRRCLRREIEKLRNTIAKVAQANRIEQTHIATCGAIEMLRIDMRVNVYMTTRIYDHVKQITACREAWVYPA